MFKLFTAGIVASTLSLGGAQLAQAGGHCSGARASVPVYAVPNGATTVVPQQAAGSGTYRRFSYEPGTEATATPAPVYRAAPVQRFSAPSRHWVPASELPKTDPFKYSGGRWQ